MFSEKRKAMKIKIVTSRMMTAMKVSSTLCAFRNISCSCAAQCYWATAGGRSYRVFVCSIR